VARWTKTVALSAGVYRFTGGRDDGIRGYIDNVPVVDMWNSGNADYSVDKVVPSGTHELRVEYFEAGGGARAEFTYARIGEVVASDGGYDAEYYPNRNLQGTPVLTRPDDAIDFNWGEGTPGDGIPADNFSARWTKSVTVAEVGTYKFTVTGDDGVRLYVDGQILLDKWIPQSATTYIVTRQLTAGAHEIVLEYFEASGDAVAKLRYEPTSESPPPPPPPPEPFAAEYFDNSALTGDPVVTRTDDAIDFDWGEASPGSEVPINLFSARWTRTKIYAAGIYRFSVTGDDGVRVLVDGTQVVDGWFYQAPSTYSADVPLLEGEHTVVVEYFEHTGGAVARFSELKVADSPPPG
jgi:PA14 domain